MILKYVVMEQIQSDNDEPFHAFKPFDTLEEAEQKVIEYCLKPNDLMGAAPILYIRKTFQRG